jgi:type IV pilus assembly protein PilA
MRAIKSVRGFTLIELMTVVSTIGILASIAIPSYQTYAVRARVTEGLVLADYSQKAVEDSWINTLALPLVGLPAAQINPASSVQSIAIDATTGDVTVTFGTAAGTMNGNFLTLVPTLNPASPVSWVCQVDMPAHDPYVPPSCRI